MVKHDPAAFELIFPSETAWCCLHWRQLCVYVYACLCVWRTSRAAERTVLFCKARAVTVCMCLCQHDGGEGCYSDLMNPSAFKGHSLSRMQAEQTSSDLGTCPAAGGLGISFSKAVQQGQAWINIEFIQFFPWNIGYFQRKGWGWKLCSHTLNPPFAYCTKHCSLWFFSEDWE